MNDNDIILGLKCLADEDEILCKDCAFRYMDRGFACKKNVSKAAIDLINRQKARTLELQGDLKFVRGTVKRLLELSDEQKAKIEQLKEAYSVYEETTGLKQVRAEAIREFAERLKESAFACDVSFGFGREHCEEAVTVLEIDNLAKEMTEVKK